MKWRRVLIDWPARVVDAWAFTYRAWIVVTAVTTVTMVVIVLLLAVFGIRWGW